MAQNSKQSRCAVVN